MKGRRNPKQINNTESYERKFRRGTPSRLHQPVVSAQFLPATFALIFILTKPHMKELPTKFGQWRVWKDGTIESLTPSYVIDPEFLRNGTDWLDHMSQKRWVDIDAFMKAYEYALNLTNWGY